MIPSALVIAAGAMALVLAIAVWVAAPGRRQNRRFAALMAVEGVWVLTFFGILDFIQTERVAFAVLSLAWVTMVSLPWLYLAFIATIETRLAAWLRHPAGAWVPWAGLVAVQALYWLMIRPLATGVFKPDQGIGSWTMEFRIDVDVGDPLPIEVYAFIGSIVAIGVVGLYGLAAAVAAWLEADRASPQRRRNGVLAIAFGLRDTVFVAAFLLLPVVAMVWDPVWLDGFAALAVQLPLVVDLVFVPLVAYGIVRAQVFAIDLTIKRTIPRAFLVALVAGAFIVVSEVVESMITAQAGLVTGVLAAVLVSIAFQPITRAGARMADRLLPGVSSDERYQAQRRQEIYRDTLEAMLFDGRIDAREREILARLRSKLELDDAVAGRIEDQVVPAIHGVPGTV